jgi:transposase
MRPKGSAEALEVRRRIAAKLLQKGKGIREVACLVEASPSAVHGWKQLLDEGGLDALKAKPHPGRPGQLTAEQKTELEQKLRDGPLVAGFSTDLWTLERVAQVIERCFGVQYHPGHVWKILREIGWSTQKPERRARERDEEAIERWRGEDWPRLKKKPGEKDGVSF